MLHDFIHVRVPAGVGVRLHLRVCEQLCWQSPTEMLGVPLPFGLTVDGVRIEIGECLWQLRLEG